MGFVYMIKCISNGFVYVGSSASQRSYRRYRHFWELEKGIHGNRIMQCTYNKYGKNSFSYSILQADIPREIVKDIENIWIGALCSMRDDRKGGMNATDAYCSSILSSKDAGCCSETYRCLGLKGGMYGKRHSEESKLKTSNSLKGRKRGPYKLKNKNQN